MVRIRSKRQRPGGHCLFMWDVWRPKMDRTHQVCWSHVTWKGTRNPKWILLEYTPFYTPHTENMDEMESMMGGHLWFFSLFLLPGKYGKLHVHCFSMVYALLHGFPILPCNLLTTLDGQRNMTPHPPRPTTVVPCTMGATLFMGKTEPNMQRQLKWWSKYRLNLFWNQHHVDSHFFLDWSTEVSPCGCGCCCYCNGEYPPFSNPAFAGVPTHYLSDRERNPAHTHTVPPFPTLPHFYTSEIEKVQSEPTPFRDNDTWAHW
jgi:hypothetical protein